MTSIYLDHNATTPLDPEVRAEMVASLESELGNASSIHSRGQAARRLVDRARRRVAHLIGAQPDEIIFTSGGTESCNLAVLGAAGAASDRRPGVVTTAIEHPAVLNACRELERRGARLSFVPVGAEGLLDAERLAAVIGEHTALVSVMLANNDLGTVQPVAALSTLARQRGVLLHSDAVQAVGKIEVCVNALGVDLLSLSGHKLNGPQGAGALFVRRGASIHPLFFGGHQERKLRPGTENVAAIAGLGKACELAGSRLAADAAHLLALRESFEAAICDRIPGTLVNGREAPRLPNTSNLGFPGLEGEALAINLDLLGLAVSTGAACSTASHEPSHVLLAMGRSKEEASSSVRFSFGRGNTAGEVARAVELVCQAVALLRRGVR